MSNPCVDCFQGTVLEFALFLTASRVWAISSVVERFLHTEEATGSIPVSPTIPLISSGTPSISLETLDFPARFETVEFWTETEVSATLLIVRVTALTREFGKSSCNKRGNGMKATFTTVGILMLALVATGCSTTHQPGMSAEDREYTPPTSIYNILDSTALVYSDPAAGSPVNDNPVRWLGFLLHPIGQALDYGINRPAYMFASKFQYLSGYTAEDTMVDSQRR